MSADKRLKRLVEMLHSKNAKLDEEDGSDLSIDMPGSGSNPSKLREYAIGEEYTPSKLKEKDYDETPALPSKESFENNERLMSSAKKSALRTLRSRPVKR